MPMGRTTRVRSEGGATAHDSRLTRVCRSRPRSPCGGIAAGGSSRGRPCGDRCLAGI